MIIKEAIRHLNKGKTILYPTDTVWGVGCDASNEKAVSRIYKIKKRNESKSLVILVDSLLMLQKVIPKIPEYIIAFIKKTTEPTTIIYPNPVGLASNVIADDNTVGIRIVQDSFCHDLIHRFGKPIVSTSANISGAPTAKSFDEINQSIIEQVDFVAKNPLSQGTQKSSKIIRFSKDGQIIQIRP